MTNLKPRILSEDPALEQAFHDWLDLVYAETVLSARLLEICRLRAAFHAQCPHCMYHRFTDPGETGIDEGLVCSLEKPEEAPSLTDRERSALRYVDLITTNRHQEVSDATFLDLRSHFTEREIVELGIFLAAVHGQQRIRGAIRADIDELPAEFQAAAGSIRLVGEGELHLRKAGRNAAGAAGDTMAGTSADPHTSGAGIRPTALPREQFPDAYQVFTADIPDAELGMRRYYAHTPEIAVAWEQYSTALMEGGSLPRRLKELVLLRLALWHGNAPEIAARSRAAGLDKLTVKSLRPPYDTSIFQQQELVSLRYADLLSGDHFAITSSVIDEFGRSLSLAELSDLGQLLAAHVIQIRVTGGWVGESDGA